MHLALYPYRSSPTDFSEEPEFCSCWRRRERSAALRQLPRSVAASGAAHWHTALSRDDSMTSSHAYRRRHAAAARRRSLPRPGPAPRLLAVIDEPGGSPIHVVAAHGERDATSVMAATLPEIERIGSACPGSRYNALQRQTDGSWKTRYQRGSGPAALIGHGGRHRSQRRNAVPVCNTTDASRAPRLIARTMILPWHDSSFALAEFSRRNLGRLIPPPIFPKETYP